MHDEYVEREQQRRQDHAFVPPGCQTTAAGRIAGRVETGTAPLVSAPEATRYPVLAVTGSCARRWARLEARPQPAPTAPPRASGHRSAGASWGLTATIRPRDSPETIGFPDGPRPTQSRSPEKATDTSARAPAFRAWATREATTSPRQSPTRHVAAARQPSTLEKQRLP